MPANNPFADEPIAHGLRLQSVSDSLNPYASPVHATEADVPEPVGVWRDGMCVVFHQRAAFPQRCILTGEPTELRHWQTFQGVSPAGRPDLVLVLGYGLCAAEQRRMRQLPWVPLAIVGATGGLILMVGIGIAATFPIADEAIELLQVLGVVLWGVLAAACLFPYIRARSLLRVMMNRAPYFWISGASESFLNTLPPWQGR